MATFPWRGVGVGVKYSSPRGEGCCCPFVVSYCQEPQRSEPLERSCINNTPGLLLPVIPLTSEREQIEQYLIQAMKCAMQKVWFLLEPANLMKPFPNLLAGSVKKWAWCQIWVMFWGAIQLTPFCMLSQGGGRGKACNGDFYWLYERSGHSWLKGR